MPTRATPVQLALGRRKGTPAQQREIKNDLLAASQIGAEARKALRAMLAGRDFEWKWEGVRLLPPGSLVETCCAAFQDDTDIPLEIPLIATLTAVAAYALKKGASIKLNKQHIRPSLWTIVLAASGAGKTWGYSQIFERVGGKLDRIPDASSAAKWIENLSEHNEGIWVRDEMGQFLKMMETQTYAQEIKDYLLRAYDHDVVSRNIKKNPIVIEHPALCVLGFSVDDTWPNCVSPEMMLDGFAQRFSYVLAKPRACEPVPLYDLGDWDERIAADWKRLEALRIHAEYVVAANAREAFRTAFKVLYRRAGGRIPMSFFRCKFARNSDPLRGGFRVQ